MADNSGRKLTPFERLNLIFGKSGVDPSRDRPTSNQYNLGDDEVIARTDSKEEYERKKREAQQNKYLKGLWQKVDNNVFQYNTQYESTRLAAYSDYENMEFYPEISATLDIMMEEANTPNVNGDLLNIYSDSDRVKKMLKDLFYNRMDIHTNLPMWTRNLCKYGDNFVFLNLNGEEGVTGVRQMPNFEIERKEGDLYNSLVQQGAISNPEDSPENSEDSRKVRFFWRGKDIYFNDWQMAHFRLLTDDRRLPYGASVLDKARRIWKQLQLSEDAMMVYRVSRAPERRVYKIYVGNLDEQDVQPFVNEMANNFKRKPMVDPETGQMDLNYNQLAVDQDYFVPVRDENAQSPIETLPGAQNLGEIADIDFLQKKLFTALRVPKSFLGFEEPQGEGKNLALQDIRFSRTINRIQQSIIQELNKVAMIHLYLLGFKDDLDNFTLTMNNPSTQAEMLKVEHLQQKISAYKDAVADAGNGFGAMSMTKAKKQIMGESEEEIRQDLLEQRMERAAAAELDNTSNVIKHTGTFDKVDRIFGDMEKAKEGGQDEGEEGGGEEEGGDFGGGGAAGGELDFGAEELPDEEGEEGGENLEDLAGEEGIGAEEEGGEEEAAGEEGEEGGGEEEGTEEEGGMGESKKRKNKKLLEERKNKYMKELKRKKNKYSGLMIEKLANYQVNDVLNEDTKKFDPAKMQDRNVKINRNVQRMMEHIDKEIGTNNDDNDSDENTEE